MNGANPTIVEIFGLLGAIVGLAALGLLLAKGDETVKIIKVSGGTFVKAIKAATEQG